jgi:predicted metal-dependent enzyme (double-stranded beta helix superfamily)
MTGSIRECAARIIELLDKVGDDVLAEEDAINAAMRDLLAIPGLDTMIVNPVRNNTESGLGWIYYDGDVRIVRGTMHPGMNLEPHNHGSWNLFGVYSGALLYKSYRRLDDGSVPFHAKLEIVENRIMRAGDVTVLPGPPDDIHSALGLAPDTVTVLVARAPFNPRREQYLPDEHAYLVFEGDGLDAVKG